MPKKKTKRLHVPISHRIRRAAHRWVSDGRSWLQLSNAAKVKYDKLHNWKKATGDEVGMHSRTLDRIEKVVGHD